MNKKRAACREGHPMTPENTYVMKNGRRACRACIRRRARVRYDAQFRAEPRRVGVVIPDPR